MQVTLNVPDNLALTVLQKRLREFEELLREEAEELDRQETDEDGESFDAAARSPEVEELLSQLSHKL